MTALSIALKDIQIILRDRFAVLYLFVVPMVFILAFSGALGGPADPVSSAVALPVVNLDPGTEETQDLIDALNMAGGLQVELYDQEEAGRLLEDSEIDRLLTIPEDYAANVVAGRPVTLLLESGPDASQTTTQAVRAAVEGVAQDMSLQTQLLAGFEQMGAMQAASDPEQQAFTAERIVAQAESQFERARTAPLLGVEEAWPEHLLGEREDFSMVEVSVSGFAVLFAFLTAQATAQSIHREKKVGTFRRLLAAPMSKAAMLAGKMIPNLLTSLVQIVVIFGASALLLPLLGLGRLTLGKDPLALVLVSLMVAVCSTALGVLIAAIARTENQIGGLSTVALWLMGAVAGSFIPSFLLGDFFNAVGKVVPHYWANQAYNSLIVRGQGLADVAIHLAALLGFSLVFFVVGLWRFDFD